MKRFIEGVNRTQSTLFPESLEDYIAEDNPVRVVDVFVDGLSLEKQGFRAPNPKPPAAPLTISTTFMVMLVVCSANLRPGA